MFRFAIFSFAFVMLAGSVTAETFDRTVSANKTSSVAAHAIYYEGSGSCRAGEIPIMKVAKAPGHGKVTIKKTSFKLSKDAGSCAGKRVKGVAILYRPNSGYRGKDTFTLGTSFFRYDGSSQRSFRSNKYNIKVK